MSKVTRNTRAERPIAEFEADLVAGERFPFNIASDFIDTLDDENIEARLAAVSPRLLERVTEIAKNNILTFDSIIADTHRMGGYAGGWEALRDWARRQPWVAEETKRVGEILARLKAQKEAEAGLSFGEQGRMLGILRVDLMRAKTPEQRASIEREIAELEATFAKANREAR